MGEPPAEKGLLGLARRPSTRSWRATRRRPRDRGGHRVGDAARPGLVEVRQHPGLRARWDAPGHVADSEAGCWSSRRPCLWNRPRSTDGTATLSPLWPAAPLRKPVPGLRSSTARAVELELAAGPPAGPRHRHPLRRLRHDHRAAGGRPHRADRPRWSERARESAGGLPVMQRPEAHRRGRWQRSCRMGRQWSTGPRWS
jgi:hypothetical protein